MKRFVLVLAALMLAACATEPLPDELALPQERMRALERFRPNPTGAERNIDYDVIDEFLDLTVLDLGPSTRKRLQRPPAPSGTRVNQGHVSPVRLEGNKVLFSEFNTYTNEAVREYADSLEKIGNQTDITALPRNEQLAYWLNLHNVTLLAVLAERYPVFEPSRLRLGEELLHDAKLVEIDGVALSLRDIRQGIVYPHWDDPRVIYGFWHGDLAGPSLHDRAFSSANLNTVLTKNAEEFINALRGVDEVGRRQLGVSPIYREARSAFFPNWPTDLRAHLRRHAFTPVARLLAEDRPEVVYLPYERRIADLAGGQPGPGKKPGLDALTGRDFDRESPAVRQMLRESIYKFGDPSYWQTRRATVTIIDGGTGVDEEERSPEIE
jgi:hypothetical protein